MCYMLVSTGHQQQGAAGDQSAAPTPRVKASRRLRRVTTADLGLVLGLERTEDVAGTRPRAHQLRLVPKAEPHETIEHPNLCLDLARHRLEICARTDMPAPS